MQSAQNCVLSVAKERFQFGFKLKNTSRSLHKINTRFWPRFVQNGFDFNKLYVVNTK